MPNNSLAMPVARTLLEHMCTLRHNVEPAHRLTNIGITIGEKSRSIDVLEPMMMEGISFVRINCSHETFEEHKESIKLVHRAVAMASNKLGYEMHVAIALDLKGAEIRTGTLDHNAEEVELVRGDIIRVSVNKDLEARGRRDLIFVDYPSLVHDAKAGQRIFINDGAIMLMINEVAVDSVRCLVERGGKLGNNTNVDLPGVSINLPTVSMHDRDSLQFAVENNIDVVIVSKIHGVSTIKDVRKMLGPKGKLIKIIAKIESQDTLRNFHEILANSDGVFLSRVDLGVELTPAKLLLVQKAIIASCNRAGKPIIVAGQLFESMKKRWVPRGSEVADLLNAVLDGVDCVLLSSESAIGQYPVHVVREMAVVCCDAEMAFWSRSVFDNLPPIHPALIDAAHAIAMTAVDTARQSNAMAIIVVTRSGRSAQLVALYGPRCPVLAVLRDTRPARLASLYRGIVPIVYHTPPVEPWHTEVDLRVKFALATARKMRIVETGDPVVIATPWKESVGCINNTRLQYVYFQKKTRDIDLLDEPMPTPGRTPMNTPMIKSAVSVF